MDFLKTERLVLRNLMPQDADVMFDYRNNEICSRYQKGQTKDYAEIAKMIERRRADVLSAEAPFMVAVALKETDEMIGEIVVKPKADTIELGYTFSYRYHRRGYAFEALTVLIDQLHRMAPDRAFGFACKSLILISWLPGGVRAGNQVFLYWGIIERLRYTGWKISMKKASYTPDALSIPQRMRLFNRVCRSASPARSFARRTLNAGRGLA